MNRLTYLIKNQVVTNRWVNKKSGQFEYIPERTAYRFIETTDDLCCYIVSEYKRNEQNCPIVVVGFIAFLIACWGQNELAIYTAYYQKREKEYIDTESKSPGSFKRDLKQEFIKKHLCSEQEYLESLSNNFDYITPDEKTLVLEYARNYLEYILSLHNQKLKPASPKAQETFENLLIHDRKDKVMKLLHELLDNKRGKDVVAIVKAMERLHLLKPYGSLSHLHRLMTDTFGDIATVRNFSNYMNDKPGSNIQESEIDRAVSILSQVIV